MPSYSAGGHRLANPEHLDILKQGVAAWNAWRAENPSPREIERVIQALRTGDTGHEIPPEPKS